MRYVPPQRIDNSNLVASNIPEELPVNTSGVDYDLWQADTAYQVGDQVVWYRDSDQRILIVYTCKVAGTGLNPNPFRALDGAGTIGSFAWTPNFNTRAALYEDDRNYGIETVVGRIDGAQAAFYQSLVGVSLDNEDGNEGNDPLTSPTFWRKTGGGAENWNGGTTYRNGERSVISYGTRAQIFESLQDNNTGNNPISSPAFWSYVGDSFEQHDETGIYDQGDIVISDHHEFESLRDNNSAALTDPASWLDLGATNRFRMFDYLNDRSTAELGEIDVTVRADGLVDTLGLLDLVAKQVQVICTHEGVEVYNETYDLNSIPSVSEYYSYFFDPITRQGDLMVEDLKPYAGMDIRVIIREPDGTAKCKDMVVGKRRQIGQTTYGVDYSIRDFSEINRDETFGTLDLIPRSFIDRATVPIVVEPALEESVRVDFPVNRATPTLYLITDRFRTIGILGIFRDYSLNKRDPARSTFNVEIESVT